MAENEPGKRITYCGGECVIRPLTMLGWSRFDQARPGGLGRHVHADAWEICYLPRGGVEWWVGQESHAVRGGQLFLTRPGEPHGGLDAVMNPCELFWVQVRATDDEWIKPLLEGLTGLMRRCFAAPPMIATIFEQLLTEHRRRDAYSIPSTQALLRRLLIEVLRAGEADRRQGADHSAAQRVAQLLDASLAQPPTLEQLARTCGLTPKRLRELFLAEMGLTPAEYVLRQRIGRAKLLLRQGRLSLARISAEVGFCSSQYLATAFKRIAGMTPGQYRRRES